MQADRLIAICSVVDLKGICGGDLEMLKLQSTENSKQMIAIEDRDEIVYKKVINWLQPCPPGKGRLKVDYEQQDHPYAHPKMRTRIQLLVCYHRKVCQRARSLTPGRERA